MTHISFTATITTDDDGGGGDLNNHESWTFPIGHENATKLTCYKTDDLNMLILFMAHHRDMTHRFGCAFQNDGQISNSIMWIDVFSLLLELECRSCLSFIFPFFKNHNFPLDILINQLNRECDTDLWFFCFQKLKQNNVTFSEERHFTHYYKAYLHRFDEAYLHRHVYLAAIRYNHQHLIHRMMNECGKFLKHDHDHKWYWLSHLCTPKLTVDMFHSLTDFHWGSTNSLTLLYLVLHCGLEYEKPEACDLLCWFIEHRFELTLANCHFPVEHFLSFMCKRNVIQKPHLFKIFQPMIAEYYVENFINARMMARVMLFCMSQAPQWVETLIRLPMVVDRLCDVLIPFAGQYNFSCAGGGGGGGGGSGFWFEVYNDTNNLTRSHIQSLIFWSTAYPVIKQCLKKESWFIFDWAVELYQAGFVLNGPYSTVKQHVRQKIIHASKCLDLIMSQTTRKWILNYVFVSQP